MENFRKKLLYQSKNRGQKETDLILGEFAEQHLKLMTEDQLKTYEQILQIPDVDMYKYLCLATKLPDNLESDIMLKLLSFKIKQYD